ncbi:MULTISPECIES: DUF302 domain-containing protein [Echinicola]|uniref:DUF302 domain-containing protein n=3 Tax=Echinicola TaxID=390846 RepID=L0G530_ECHVK|nr:MULTISPECIES: DUF302 domain-containing protein [Echinicola]AGA80647.1 hypothetical protein Echvi_4467 [Echinicola vietnamensis DSM 17526]AWW33047.1 DUF302 domain-containing protein [Echinicola strongylocentroti]
MTYYHEKTLENISFEEAIQKVTETLKEEGFGILTEIDVKETLKKKLDEDFRPYKILGACNPPFAHKALLAEDKIGAMLPCNVIVQQSDDSVEIAAVDPVASMQAVENKDLEGIAEEIQSKLKAVIESL